PFMPSIPRPSDGSISKAFPSCNKPAAAVSPLQKPASTWVFPSTYLIAFSISASRTCLTATLLIFLPAFNRPANPYHRRPQFRIPNPSRRLLVYPVTCQPALTASSSSFAPGPRQRKVACPSPAVLPRRR